MSRTLPPTFADRMRKEMGDGPHLVWAIAEKLWDAYNRDAFDKVAALFVEKDGCYSDIPGVDAWDIARDARRYDGPYPVVAHPPCQLWGTMAAVNYARWGGEHNRPGNDGGCFQSALNAVRMFGGVIEHPAKSRAFDAYGLTKPKSLGWQPCRTGGWVCEVWQSAYGHRANKATWLYYVGSGRPAEMDWSRPVGSHQIGFHDQRGKARNKPTLSRKEANATPIAFRDALLALVRLNKPIRFSLASCEDQQRYLRRANRCLGRG